MSYQDRSPFTPLNYLRDTMRASKNAVDLIRHWEGCRLEAYQDIGGVWTVGFGTTGPGIHEGTKVSEAIAVAMLKSDIAQVSDAVSRLVGLHTSQNQFDAIVSFAYNVGTGAFKSSRMLKLILAGKKEEASQEFLKWNHVGGVIVAGLMARREAERKLFLS